MRAYVDRVFAAGIPPERKAAVQVCAPTASPCAAYAPQSTLKAGPTQLFALALSAAQTCEADRMITITSDYVR